QIKSLSITMIIVFGIMFMLFISAKVGLIAIVPNLFPIIVNFGIMGWFGVELSMFTSLIASIAIGLAVDDTIHYLVRYNREFRKDLNDRRALRETLRDIGRPIIFTTLTISIGFSVLTLSSFKPTAIFGTVEARQRPGLRHSAFQRVVANPDSLYYHGRHIEKDRRRRSAVP
ncbi:MAG: efflux RND transporter permease subunit, partial [Deltaproteobacteria bacterium]